MPEFTDNKLEPTASLSLDITGLTKGINNHHVDVKLSPAFRVELKRVVEELVKQETSMKPGYQDKEKLFTVLRNVYLDVMTILIHRVKTDLTTTAVDFLQFGILKHMLQTSKSALDDYIHLLKSRASELRAHGSAEALSAHTHIAWITRQYSQILARINQQVLSQFSRAESRQLQAIRAQYLPSESLPYASFLENPLLWTRDLRTPALLIDHYMYWNSLRPQNDEDLFNTLNREIEELLTRQLPSLPLTPLKTIVGDTSIALEVHDELGGLLASQGYLGTPIDSRNHISENFGWLDLPDNPRTLFNLADYQEEALSIRRNQGWKAWWQYKKGNQHLETALKDVAKLLAKHGLLTPLAALQHTRQLLLENFSGIDPRQLCQCLSRQISLKKLQEQNPGIVLGNDEIKKLQKAIKAIAKSVQSHPLEVAAAFLVDLSRFRYWLKYYRFSHRVFNRMQLLSRPEDLHLSKQARTLFEMPTANEVEQDNARILHHTIMKADLRGSTVVTDQLEKKGLNPASHFSLRFFGPINEVIPQYGAGKVFIEGDAVILSFLEHEHKPQEWFSVARACGLARAVLAIVHANNRHSRQVGLPLLELGIGICYSDESPRYLFDGDHPIMISSAIGLADRMSSCSWKLRECLDPGHFNVDVLEIAEGERERGEKGQQFLRYNLNGILLDNAGFAKLKTEISLRKIRANLDGKPVLFHVGEFPDVEGKKKGLVIREGRVGLWRDGQALPGDDSALPYYEVITNGRIIAHLQGI